MQVHGGLEYHANVHENESKKAITKEGLAFNEAKKWWADLTPCRKVLHVQCMYM